MKNILPLLFVSLLSPLALAEKITSSIAGYQTVWIVDDKEFDFPLLNSREPLKVLIALKSEGKKFVSLLKDEAKITSATEDSGAKLDFSIWAFPKKSEDEKTLVVELKSKTMPSEKAKSYTVKGTLPVLTGENSEEVKTSAVAAKKQQKLKFGEHFSATISDAGKPKWGDDPFEMTLQYTFDTTKIREFRFLDPAGKPIEAKNNGSSSGGMFGNKTYTQSYSFKKAPKKLIVVADLWTDLEKTEVPFEVTVPLAR